MGIREGKTRGNTNTLGLKPPALRDRAHLSRSRPGEHLDVVRPAASVAGDTGAQLRHRRVVNVATVTRRVHPGIERRRCVRLSVGDVLRVRQPSVLDGREAILRVRVARSRQIVGHLATCHHLLRVKLRCLHQEWARGQRRPASPATLGVGESDHLPGFSTGCGRLGSRACGRGKTDPRHDKQQQTGRTEGHSGAECKDRAGRGWVVPDRSRARQRDAFTA